MSHWKRLLAMLALTSLAACGGGGGNAGTPIFGGGGTGSVSDVVITFGKDTISNSGSDAVTATITAVDASRVGVSGVPVSVAVDNNAVVTASSAATDSSGKVTASIGIGADKTTRTITLTATVGGIVRTAALRVVTDTTGTNPTAADLTLALSASSLVNGSNGTITATATAVDGNRNVIRGIPITFAVDAGATIAPSGTVTSDTGVLTATVGLGADRSNRVVTVTATSGSLVRKASFVVIGARLTASASPLVNAGSVDNLIEYTLVDSNSAPMPNQAVTISANGLSTQTRTTDLNGKVRYLYTAPATSGNLTIVATAAGDQNTQVVTVSSAVTIPPASESPRSASVQPTPSVIAVNTAGSDRNQVELRALFVGANDRPIKNIRARFDTIGGAADSYGTVSVVGSYAYSDENGIARATFTPGTRRSPTNGVTVRVCWDVADFVTPAPNSCAGAVNVATSTLTVNEGAISVSISTNRDIKSGRNDLTYIKEYVVMVVNASGQAIPNVEITPSVDLKGYYKGVYSWDGERWVRPGPRGSFLAASEAYRWTGSAWVQDGTAGAEVVCPNEDYNRNGVMETLGGVLEDMNGNGLLDPRKADVAVSMVESTRTDANGLAIVQIEYGKSLGSWIRFELAVTASVSGTAGRAVVNGVLPVAAEELTQEQVPPSFVISPYGTAVTCTNPN